MDKYDNISDFVIIIFFFRYEFYIAVYGTWTAS